MPVPVPPARLGPLAACVLVLAASGARAQAPEASPPTLSDAAKPRAPSAGGTPDRAPFSVPYGAPIGLEQARRVASAVEGEAAKRGWPMSVAIVDPHGELVHFGRMDGVQFAAIESSLRKARSAARWRRDTRAFFDAFAAASPYYATLDPGLAAAPGGFPLVVDGTIVGAVGCAGGTGDQDAAICQAAVDALAR